MCGVNMYSRIISLAPSNTEIIYALNVQCPVLDIQADFDMLSAREELLFSLTKLLNLINKNL